MSRLYYFVAAILGAMTLSAPAIAQSCDTYRVEARLLNMRAEPNVFGTILDVLRSNELVCIAQNQPAGGQEWGFVVSKSRPDGSATQKIEGWTSLRYLARVDSPGANEPTPVADGDASGLLARYPKAVVADFDGNPQRLTEMDALVAYLQMLGTLVDFSAYDPVENQR